MRASGRCTIGFLMISAGATFALADLQPPAGAPVQGLTAAQLDLWQIGRTNFDTPFTPAQGLGPIFNQNRCSACHNAPLGGSGSIFVTRFGFADKGTFDPLDAQGGSLLQAEAISAECAESIPPEANVTTKRITTSSLGIGLLEAIDDNDIIANELAVQPNVQGRIHWVPVLEDPNAPTKPGRFGWKNQLATVLSFTGDATLMEMGITNAIVGFENAPNGDPNVLAACDLVPDPEDVADGSGFTFIERVTHFQRFLAPPPQTPKSGMTGEALFVQIGCAQCHLATSYTIPNTPGIDPALQGQVIKPYSDFLMHDMGFLGDGIEQGMATGFEFRTPPLWGLRLRDPLIHDGRVAGGTLNDRLTAAIAAHDTLLSSGAFSAVNFNNLSAGDKAQVLKFLGSLGRREFDVDGNNAIAVLDLHSLKDCFGDTGVTPDDDCAIHDTDQDGNIDINEFDRFATVYTGWQGDCNKNRVNDALEIVNGTLIDADFDGIPDSCCPGDLNNDNNVNQRDLNLLLANFQSGAGGDLDGDADTDQSDLNILLSLFDSSCN